MKVDDVQGEGGIQDRRGQGGAGGFSLPGGKGAKLGVPGLIILVVGFLISQAGGGGGGAGGGLNDILGQLSGGSAQSQPAPQNTDGSKDAQYVYVDKLYALLNDYWSASFESSDQTFSEPEFVVFDAPTNTGGCGVGQPEFGPFYCPGDSTIYLDFGFYAQLEDQLGFDGDFAMAYVVAHEYGHHIQNLLGINEEVRTQTASASEAEGNELSVKLELQADCFAGVWSKSAYEQDRLETGDFDEAIDAASAVGDDAIQGEGARRESFTHGSSAERQRWFRTGFDRGDAADCDTFA